MTENNCRVTVMVWVLFERKLPIIRSTRLNKSGVDCCVPIVARFIDLRFLASLARDFVDATDSNMVVSGRASK